MIKLKDNLAEEYDLNKQMEIFKEKTKHSFLDFYDKYLPKLIYHNNNIVRDRTVAEDIATDAILKSLKKINDYNPEKARFSTWLFTISKNECIQHLNKSKKTISVDKFVDDEGTTIKDFLHDQVDTELEGKELENLNVTKGKILQTKIEELKDPYRKVIKLRELDKRSYRDITIILREKEKVSITNSFFNKKNYIYLVDPEKKKSNELIKFYSINKITNIDNGDSVEFSVIRRDKDGLISKIKVPKGNYSIDGEIPFNMSTLKSQIRNGRLILQNMVRKDFDQLDHMYL